MELNDIFCTCGGEVKQIGAALMICKDCKKRKQGENNFRKIKHGRKNECKRLSKSFKKTN